LLVLALEHKIDASLDGCRRRFVDLWRSLQGSNDARVLGILLHSVKILHINKNVPLLYFLLFRPWMPNTGDHNHLLWWAAWILYDWSSW